MIRQIIKTVLLQEFEDLLVTNAEDDTDQDDDFTDTEDGPMMTKTKKECRRVDGRIRMLKKAEKHRRYDGRIRI